jgi:hypothetical protein
MLFLLATPEYNNVQANTTKVRVHLRSGVAEIFDQHQDLMGKVENNLIEIETNFENRLEKFLFILQDAVFVVSNKGLGADKEKNQTAVYVYAKRAREISANLSVEDVSKQYDNLFKQLEGLKEKQTDNTDRVLTSKILLLEEETNFLTKTISVIKGSKG